MYFIQYTFLIEPKFQNDGENDIHEKILNGGFIDTLLISTDRGNLRNYAATDFYRQNRLPENLRKNTNIVLIGRLQLITPEAKNFAALNPSRTYRYQPKRPKTTTETA
jgi:hypothetical protein